MDLEVTTVSRADAISSPRSKEWWYVGWVDRSRTVYASFHVTRLPLVDNVTFSLFDLAAEQPVVRSRKLWLNAPRRPGMTDLSANSRSVAVRYTGSSEQGWTLAFRDRGVEADLTIRPTAPPFTKEENQFVQRYALLSLMHNSVRGTVAVEGREYRFDDAIGYADHCFGQVPRRTGWHWLAVQNEEQAFVSLNNYGPYAQRYTQLLITDADGRKEWLRLSQDASFERAPGAPDRRWRLTGWDVDLQIDLLMSTRLREKLPAVLPLWVNLTHDEFFVRARGRVLTQGRWVELAESHGVLEEHHGIW